MNFSTLQPWLELASERALNSIPAGILLAMVAWILLRIVGKQNSRTRFAVWFAALLAVAALPFIPAWGEGQAIRPEVALPSSWAVAIALAWMLFVLMAVSRIFIGVRHIGRLRRSGTEIHASDLPHPLQDFLESDGTRSVRVYRSSLVQVPTAVGFLKPAILLPEWALQDLSREELRVILLHELAHVRRWDDWTNLLQKLVRTVFFFHPAVWWIEKRISLEREMACDDSVLAHTENARAYAECLVSLAEKSFVRRGLVMAQAILGHARDTSRRLAEILDSHRSNRAQGSKPALALMAAIVSFSFILVPHSPTLIGFENVTNHAPATKSANPPPSDNSTTQASNASPTTSELAKAKVSASKAASPQVKPLEVLPARHMQTVPYGPLVVRASAEPVPTESVVVFMQTTQYHIQGASIMDVRVWRVTFIPATGEVATVISRKL